MTEKTQFSYTIIDGMTIDTDTGEIMSIETPTPEFTVHDEDTARWVLTKIGKAEAAVTAIDADADVVWAETIIANADKKRAQAKAKLDWLHTRFDGELAEYAKAQLDGKSKTWSTTVGRVSFRTVKGGLRVVDAERALTWAKDNAPDCIKTTEEFHITKLNEEQRTFATVCSCVIGSCFDVKSDTEKVTVTGEL